MTTGNERAPLAARAFVGRMFVVNLILAASCTLACLALSGTRMALAAGSAGLAGSVDLLLLGLLVLRMMIPGSRKLGLGLLLVAKFVVLAGLFLVGIKVLLFDAPGLAAGFSSTVAAVLLCAAGVAVSGREIRL